MLGLLSKRFGLSLGGFALELCDLAACSGKFLRHLINPRLEHIRLRLQPGAERIYQGAALAQVGQSAATR
jgi:hypothetical protein